MVSVATRREMLEAVAPRYCRAARPEKQRILDEFVQTTGYSRKYAIYLLHHVPRERPSRRRRRARKYSPESREALLVLWRAANGICSKRLVPYLPELITVLERCGELRLEAETKALVLQMSPATVDRVLRPARQRQRRRGLGTTKPGTLLKRQIPIRTFADWDVTRPGFLEVDLVAHCGTTTAGEYLHTLVLTDIHTTWTECVALPNRSQETVTAAIAAVRQHLPFAVLGLDSDNGSEFINANLARYCDREHITFTRSRAYKKNDQAHVEQKNWTHVRHFAGYGRYTGATAQATLAALYVALRQYMNFFQPTLKLAHKEHVGAKVHKRYDEPRTPYRRVLECADASAEQQATLRAQYEQLNPVALLRTLDRCQEALWALESTIHI